MTRLLLLAALAALLAPSALAQTCSTEWISPVDGSWTVDANWTNGAPGTETGGLAPCITAAGTYTVSFSVGGVFGGQTVTSLVLGGASGRQTLTLLSRLIVTDAAIRPNGLLTAVRAGGASQGLNATGTVTLEGEVLVRAGTTFMNDGGTLDVAPGGTLRLTDTGSASGGKAGGPSALFRVRGTIEGVGCPTLGNGDCQINAPVEVLGGTLRAASGVLRLQAGGTMNGATLDAGDTGLLLLGGSSTSPSYVVQGTLSGAPSGQVYADGGTFAAGPANATLAIGGTGLQLAYNVLLTSAGGSFTNTGLLVEATTTGGSSSIANGIVRNEGVFELPSSLGLYVGGLLINEPGGVVRVTGGGRLSGNVSGTGRFENAGLFVLDAPGESFTFSDGGSGRFSGPFSRPGSEIRVAAGSLDLSGGPGSRILPAGATLSGAGSVSVPSGFAPEGTVSPGTAAQPLARLVHGAYFYPVATSRLVIDVDAGGRSDTLATTFSSGGPTGARLAGVLVVRVRPGYVPAIGDAFTILRTVGTVTGHFAAVVPDGAPEGLVFVPEIVSLPGGQAVVLRVAAVAAGGPITVSDTAPVAGGYRTFFLGGPGAAGVTAARLECVDCVDTVFYNVIPSVLGELGTAGRPGST